ncbi:MAG: tetratricopeptide repeat protein [Leptolyngbyaceae cyanobacterium SM1_3_5]|nr:tetratricopeptide repeat protein [Leptolyngbyaceae cyanobacterium SM1_3_5]
MQQPPASIARTSALPSSALPIDAQTCYSRGEALANMGRYLEALDHFDRALALMSDHCKTWTFRGVALQRLNHYREAYASYDRALGIQRRSIWQRLLHRSDR